MNQSTTLATIDLDDLLLVNGGDTWQDYKTKNVQNWNDTKARANEAIKHNLVNGNWNAGKFADNAAGTIFNGGKMIWDASLGQVGNLFK